MDVLINELMDFGVLAIILAIVLYDNYKMKQKLFSVIENNTKALTELTIAQKQRRREFKNE